MWQQMVVPRLSSDEHTFAVVRFKGVTREQLLPRLKKALTEWGQTPAGAEQLADADDDFNVGDLSNLDTRTLTPHLERYGIRQFEVEVYSDGDAGGEWEYDTPLLT